MAYLQLSNIEKFFGEHRATPFQLQPIRPRLCQRARQPKNPMLPRHFLSVRLTPLALCAALAGFSVHAAEPGVARFDIARFQVEGNTLVSSETIARAVAPLTGPQREFSDIQRAVDAIERAYVQSGFTAVKVTVPEQELAGGAVKIRVVEAVMTSVSVVGNQHFSTENIRASLGSLQTGAAPRLGDLSASIQLANDNPAKQVSVSMAEGSLPGTVDATVSVIDHKPLRFIATLDNTGTEASGHWRTGIAVQHANLFDRDHVGTLAYSTSPDGPSGQNLNVYSVGYRVPLYALGDSIDFVYGRSSVNTPSSSPTLGGVLGFTGRGETLGLRYNHFLGRSGETAAKLVFGLDHKKIDSRCDVNGMPVSTTGATPPISSCVPYTTTPLSITYTGQRDGVDQALAYNIGLARNLASGARYTNLDGHRPLLLPDAGQPQHARWLHGGSRRRHGAAGAGQRLAGAPGRQCPTDQHAAGGERAAEPGGRERSARFRRACRGRGQRSGAQRRALHARARSRHGSAGQSARAGLR